MMWVKFSERKPNIGSPLLIISLGIKKNESFLKSYNSWDEEKIKPCSQSYWWNGGVNNVDIAVTIWHAIHDTYLTLIFDEDENGTSN